MDSLILSLGVFLATVAAWSDEPSVSAPAVPWKTSEYTLIAREMSLREVLMGFGTSQGLSVILSKKVEGNLSGDFRKLAPQKFLDTVTMLNNLTWYYDGTTLYIYSNDEIETLLLDLKYMKAGEVRDMLKQLGVEDARFPLKTTSNDELVLLAGPPRYVLLIAELVAKADKLREKRAFSEIETRVFKLKHTWADDVSLPTGGGETGGSIKGIASMLQDILGTTAQVRTKEKDRKKGDKAEDSADDQDDYLAENTDNSFQPIIKPENRLNAVIVRDVSSRMPRYEKLIAELDVPQKLVEIAVTSLELSKNDALDWQLSLAVKGSNGDFEGAAGQNPANLFSPEDLLGKGLSGAMSYIGKHVTVSASLSALRQKGKARSISRTSILTMNNMSASITDTQSYHAKVVGTEVASLQEVTAGTNLNVKPRVIVSEKDGEQNKFWMTITLSDGGFESVTVDSMPVTRSSSVTTQASVYEGDCILLGGYFRDIEEKAGWGIPYLRDIPYIGWIFGGIGKKKETVQRMFIVTPYLVDLEIAEIARLQASRQRDIKREETLEDDKKEDDAVREMHDLEREDRDKAFQQKNKNLLEKRKGELKLEQDKRKAELDKSREEWKKEQKENREQWEQSQKPKPEPANKPEQKTKLEQKGTENYSK